MAEGNAPAHLVHEAHDGLIHEASGHFVANMIFKSPVLVRMSPDTHNVIYAVLK